MKDRQVIGQLMRFACIGTVNSVLYIVLAMLFNSAFGFAALAASILAYAISAAVAFFGHKVLTFGTPAKAPAEMARFLVASGMGLSLAALIPILLSGFTPLISFLSVLALVPVCSFLLLKFFVFRT